MNNTTKGINMATAIETNPVVQSTPLRAYPGWAVREYSDGTFDAATRGAMSWTVDSFSHAVAAARWFTQGEDMDSLVQVPGYCR